MSNYSDVQSFINKRQQEIAMEYDDVDAHSRMLQQAYMVGVLISTATTLLDFIEIRYGEEAAREAKQRALILK